MLQVSQNAEDLVISEEVGSQKQYEKMYRHPEWPGGSSGVTGGIGYDFGYVLKDTIAHDWAVLPSNMVGLLQSVAGLKGQPAHAALVSVKSVDISWEQAIYVFDDTDKPKYLNELDRVLPNCSKLDPNCVGALWSLTYNRGASFNADGDRFKEMRAIKAHMVAEQYDKIPAEFRSMKRLWNNGLVGRREREARLFERGLAIMSGEHSETSAPRVVTRTEQIKRNAAATGTIAGGASGTTAQVAPLQVTATSSHHAMLVVSAIVIAFVVGFIAITYIGRHKRLPKADPMST